MSHKIIGALALALMLPLAACDDSTSVAEPGTMTLLLTDAPGDFGQAVVVIQSIELVGEGEPVMLREGADTTDLLTLSDDVEEMVADATVPGGTYGQVRFIIPEACITVEQDTDPKTFLVYSSDEAFTECGTRDGDLQLPSFEETGIKVTLPAGASDVDGDQHVVVLDFNVEESFGQQAGASGMWVMTPVIKADELEFTGSLTATLTAAEGVDPALLGDFQAHFGETPVAFTDEDEDGTFEAEFLYMLPDDYQVYVELQDDAPAHDFTLDPTSPQSVTLGSAESVTVAFEVTSATAGS